MQAITRRKSTKGNHRQSAGDGGAAQPIQPASAQMEHDVIEEAKSRSNHLFRHDHPTRAETTWMWDRSAQEWVEVEIDNEASATQPSRSNGAADLAPALSEEPAAAPSAPPRRIGWPKSGWRLIFGRPPSTVTAPPPPLEAPDAITPMSHLMTPEPQEMRPNGAANPAEPESKPDVAVALAELEPQPDGATTLVDPESAQDIGLAPAEPENQPTTTTPPSATKTKAGTKTKKTPQASKEADARVPTIASGAADRTSGGAETDVTAIARTTNVDLVQRPAAQARAIIERAEQEARALADSIIARAEGEAKARVHQIISEAEKDAVASAERIAAHIESAAASRVVSIIATIEDRAAACAERAIAQAEERAEARALKVIGTTEETSRARVENILSQAEEACHQMVSAAESRAEQILNLVQQRTARIEAMTQPTPQPPSAKPAPDTAQALPAEESLPKEGTLEMVIQAPVDLAKMERLLTRLKKMRQIRVMDMAGSAGKGVIVRLCSPNLSRLPIMLESFPEVESVSALPKKVLKICPGQFVCPGQRKGNESPVARILVTLAKRTP